MLWLSAQAHIEIEAILTATTPTEERVPVPPIVKGSALQAWGCFEECRSDRWY